MKVVTIACLGVALYLSGCATPTTTTTPSGSGTGTGTGVSARSSSANSSSSSNSASASSNKATSTKSATRSSTSTNASNTAVQDAPVVTLTPSRELTGSHSSASNTSGQVASSDIVEQETSSRTVASTSAPVDLWDRIRRGYAMPDLDNDLVHDREQWYSARPDYILRMTERSRKYMFHIVEELELRNMPTELALLPFVESAFNPQAVSTVKAAGMWQFMPATGKSFELKQNIFRDDRRDVLASTRAALDYLQKLHRMFGDWQLALAAYNWGEGSVGRAIAKNRKAGLSTAYTDLSMPAETRMYVPKLQAIKNIVANPDAFHSKLPDIGNHPYFDTVTIHNDIDVALAAKLAEVDLADFKALNPSLNKPVIMVAGTPQILLPWDNAKVFQTNLENFTGARLASWTVWIAPSTMRAGEAAAKVGMDEAEFRNINNIPPRMLIRAGSALLVPRSGNRSEDIASTVADTAQLNLAPEVVLVPIKIRAGKHDTVQSIAKRYKTTAANVAQWNKVATGASFKRGQNIVVYVAKSAPSKPVAKSSKNAAASTQKSKTATTKSTSKTVANKNGKRAQSNSKATAKTTAKATAKAAPSKHHNTAKK